jgi:type 1 fimbriae regulatory protein FimB/type 1 fimbriae regulatory protein FimE
MAELLDIRTRRKSSPRPVTGKVPPRQVSNIEKRPREHLTREEVERLMEAARKVGRHGHRDATLILVAFRHGLRVSEAVGLQWAQIDFRNGLLHVNRLKNGVPSTHPLSGPELRALRKLKRDYPDTQYVFVSERKAPLSTAGVRKMLARAGKMAKIGFPVHPHQLRHATGYVLANRGVDTRTLQHYMGHKKIEHTVRYSALDSNRFNGLWED